MIESGVTFDFGQLVIDNEFARMIKHALGGIRVDDETLAVDVIHEIGSFRDFLSHEDTLKHMRVHSQPRLIDRRVREDWQADGARDLYARATVEARRILETHEVQPLADDVASRVRAMVDEADAAVRLS